jgi:hypothetical protein
MVHCRDATASSLVAKVQGEVLAHFHAVTVIITAVCGIDCLACQDEVLVNNSLMLMKIMSTLVFALDEFGFSVYGYCFLTQTLA